MTFKPTTKQTILDFSGQNLTEIINKHGTASRNAKHNHLKIIQSKYNCDSTLSLSKCSIVQDFFPYTESDKNLTPGNSRPSKSSMLAPPPVLT